MVADVVVHLCLIARESASDLEFSADGTVRFLRGGAVVGTVLPASGMGDTRWSAFEIQVAKTIDHLEPARRREVDLVLAANVTGPRGLDLAPPESIVGLPEEGSLFAIATPAVYTTDEVREDPRRVRWVQ